MKIRFRAASTVPLATVCIWRYCPHRSPPDSSLTRLVSCAVNSLEKSGELGKDPSADLVQMNGLGFWFHSATHERMCFSSAWTEGDLSGAAGRRSDTRTIA